VIQQQVIAVGTPQSFRAALARSLEVEDDAVELLTRVLEDRLAHVDGRRAHQPVQSAVLGDHGVERRGQASLIGDVDHAALGRALADGADGAPEALGRA